MAGPAPGHGGMTTLSQAPGCRGNRQADPASEGAVP
jgi:hypothetical protein